MNKKFKTDVELEFIYQNNVHNTSKQGGEIVGEATVLSREKV